MSTPFVPKYDAKFIGPVRDNILALFKLYEADALKYMNGGTAMKPTKVWRISHWYNTLFPATSVVARRTQPAAGDDEGSMGVSHLIDLEVEMDGPDADVNTRDVEKRIGAYDHILRKYGT